MVRSLCEQHSSTRVVRDMENDPLGVPAGLWAQMKQSGLLAMMLPEQYGGIGLDMLDRVVIYQELGGALAPGPHFVSSVMGALAILKAGSDAQKQALLPANGRGDLVVSAAWLEPDNGFGAPGVQLRAETTPDGYRLNGIKRHVFYARAAQGETPQYLSLVDVGVNCSLSEGISNAIMEYMSAKIPCVAAASGGNRKFCLDFGTKAVASEMPQPRVSLLNVDGYRIAGHNEEHLIIDVPDAARYRPETSSTAPRSYLSHGGAVRGGQHRRARPIGRRVADHRQEPPNHDLSGT